MSKLEPRIEAVRQKYDLQHNDFWQIKQNGQWVCKHAALEIVAAKANVEWLPPVIIEADAPNLVTSMIVTGKMGDRLEWATGETNETNYKVVGKQPAYPWAMSEKRAKDRVILKLVGIHGLVYSEDEMPTDVATVQQQEPKTGTEAPTNPISAAEQKRQCAEIENELIDCRTIADVDICAKTWAHIMKRDGWSQTYIDFAKPKFQMRRDQINADRETQDGSDDRFPGDLPSNTDIRNVAGRPLHTMEGM